MAHFTKGGGGLKPPKILSYLYKQLYYLKGRPNNKRGKNTELSGYKQSLEVSKYMNSALVTCNKLDPGS